MKRTPRDRKPDLEYPCRWTYKLFGTDRERIRSAVAQVMPGSDYTLTLSHSSRQNRYHCMNLELTVVNEEDRLGIYDALSAHQEILYVL